MSDKKEKNPFEEMQEKVQEMMKDPKFASMFNQFASGQMQGGEPVEAPPPKEDEKKDHEETLKRIREFNLKPREIKDYLDRFVIEQNEAKKVLSVAICDHYNHVRQCLEKREVQEQEYTKQNIILLGPTGVGKTYLMRCIAKLIGVPFVKADATKFSETGYVGHDVEDLVRDLVKNANGDIDLAEYGIIYIDEIDKISGQGQAGGRDVSGRGVQINLLKLMEETEVNLHSQTDILGQMQAMMDMQKGGKAGKRLINTRHILFIVSGAFDTLGEQVKKRVESSRIGFSQSPASLDSRTDYLKQVETGDFIKYGFEPEFIGRLPIRVSCSSLRQQDLEKILLQSEGSILSQYRSDFSGYGIECEITREAIQEIARQASTENTGARGLMTVLEKVFRNFKYEIPSTSIRKITINGETISDSKATLRKLLDNNQSNQVNVLKDEVKHYAARFRKEHGLELVFEEAAIKALVDESLRSEKTIRGICESRFRDFQHGLQLIARNTGQKQFRIDEKTVKAPDRELSQWVVESFRKDEQ